MSNRSIFCIFLLSFAVTFGWSLFFQYRIFDCKITFILDSGHYLFTAGGITNALALLLANKQSDFDSLLPSLAADLLIDGPILPIAGAICLWLSGQPATGCSWYVVTAFICFCNAITGGSISALLALLSGSKRLALLGGTLWALYPGTVICSGRFLTEPMAASLLLLTTVGSTYLVSSRCSQKTQTWLAFHIGLISTFGFLLKPVLVALWFTLPMLALFKRCPSRLRPINALLAFFIGALTAITPWLLFSRLTTGQFYLTPQRLPVHNLAKGHDLGADGWSSDPCSPMTTFYENSKDSRFILFDAWQRKPLEIANLYMRKVTRTIGFQWNDFRQKVYGLSVDSQNFVHAVMLAAAICGILSLLLRPVLSKTAEFISTSVCMAIATQTLIYLPFEAITRYGFCAVPFVLIAAIYSVKGLTRSSLEIAAYLMALVVCVAAIKLPIFETIMPTANAFNLACCETSFRLIVVLVASAIVYLKIKRNTNIKSWRFALAATFFFLLVVAPTACISSFLPEYQSAKISLEKGERLERSLELPISVDEKNADFLLLIDSDKRIDDAVVSVNDVSLTEPSQSINKLDADYYSLFNLMRLFSAVADSRVNNMRQWRVIPIPVSLLKLGKKNRLSVSATQAGVDIYCDRILPGAKEVALPNRGFSGGFYCNGAAGADSRLPDIEPTAISDSETTLFKNSRSKISQTEAKLPSWQLPRLYVLSSQSSTPKDREQRCNVALPDRFKIGIPVTNFDPALWQSSSVTDRTLNLNRYTFKLARSHSIEKSLPAALSKWPLINLKLTGLIKATGRAKKAGILVTIVGGTPNNSCLILPNNPPYVECSSIWEKFEIKDTINMEGLTDGKIVISCLPGRWEQLAQYGVDRTIGSFLLKDLELSVEPSKLPRLTKSKTIKY